MQFLETLTKRIIPDREKTANFLFFSEDVMKYYIIATRKSGSHESEITHYMVNTNASANGTIILKANFRNQVNLNQDTFYSYNIRLRTQVECEWYKSQNGEAFLKSDPNGQAKDNLLELPDC